MPTRGSGKRETHAGVDADALVGAAAQSAAGRFAREVLQYEWRSYLDAYPPESEAHTWEPDGEGRPWGRVAPAAWRAARDDDVDLHFEHYPTEEQFSTGEFRFDLHLEDCATGTADFDNSTVHRRFRDRFGERAAADIETLSEQATWSAVQLTDELDEHVLWRARYLFMPGDERAYYETLRRAIEDHQAVATLASELLAELVPSAGSSAR